MTIISIHITASADPMFPIGCHVSPSSVFLGLEAYAELSSEDEHCKYVIAATSLTFFVLRDEEPDSFEAPVLNTEAISDPVLGLLIIENQVPRLLTRQEPEFRLSWAKFSKAITGPNPIVRERDSVLYYVVTSQFGAIAAPAALNEDDED